MKLATVLLAAAEMILFQFISCELPTETGPPVEEPFPKEKCESFLVNCSCYNYVVVYGVVCKRMADYSALASLLAGGEVFEVNSTYEITLTDVQYVPPRVLDGLIVFRLTLDDPKTGAIDKEAFDGVIRLRRFQVLKSQLQNVPDFRKVRHSIRSVKILNSRLSALDGEGMQNLSLLNTVSFVNNSIRSIDPEFFKGSDNIVTLDLSHNLLTSIPPTLFDPLHKLQKLSLSYNQLKSADHLFAICQPRFIFLDFNNLTDVDSVLFPNMTNLETVVFSSNPIRKISEGTFGNKAPNVRFVYLDHCLLTEFDVRHYRGLPALDILDLSYNMIEEVGSQTIDIGSKLELVLDGNRIRRFDASITYTVKRIYLNENLLRSLGRTLQYSQMKEVAVAQNQLQYLRKEDFKAVHETTNLELQGNQIQWIDRLAFEKLRNYLHYLDLSSNRIPAINGSLRFLSQLKSLNLSSNYIETFEEGEFRGLNELAELYLQNNRIKDLGDQLPTLPQLQFIVVTDNNIASLRPRQFPKSIKFIYLAENPIECNCRLLPFLQWLNDTGSPSTEVRLCPPSAEVETLETPSSCPENCSCSCDEDGEDSFMFLDCSSKNFTTVPAFLAADFPRNAEDSRVAFDHRRSPTLDQNTHPSYHIRDRVLGIDLQNNSIAAFDPEMLPLDLLHLLLANNSLRSLPDPVLFKLKHLRKTTLSGNPWDCDCQTIGFKKWLLSSMSIVQDLNNTRCAYSADASGLEGKVISTLTDLDLCPADIGLYVSVAFCVLTFLLLCLAAKILYTRYEMHIRVYLYSRGFTWVKARDLDHDKQFDAFISFSHKDEEFVAREIISTIEKKDPNIRLCIHYKHFRAGEFIHDNILYAVQNSKRTVLILSRNFLESEWCLMEFRAAHVQALEDKVHRILVVKVGELPKEIDPAIKVYLDSTTYLAWGEKHFWDNLFYVLPTSSTPRSPHQDSNLKLIDFPVTEKQRANPSV